MKQITISLALVLTLFNVSASNIDDLLNDFVGNDWEKILTAKNELENLEEIGLSQIVDLLDLEKTVKVTNTGDLIYPGAHRFYGHGMIIDYDIDQIQVRTGWLLEEITFQNFGFSLIHDRDENLKNHITQHFKEFLSQDYLKKLDSMSADQMRIELKKLSIKKAKDWWLKESNEWNRLQGIIDAINSNDSRRQNIALQYLKSGESRCKGLSIETYLDQLKGRISYLSKSKINRISEQAVFILNDSDFEFIRIKNK